MGLIKGIICYIKDLTAKIARHLIEIFLIPFFLAISFIARLLKKPIDVGLGPEPLINNIYHKKALLKYGYSVETFVISVYFITSEFDYRGDYIVDRFSKFNRLLGYLGMDSLFLGSIHLFLRSLFKYKILYIYFNGGPLFPTIILRRYEHIFYKLANIKIVVFPYGGDVQDLSRCPNLLFKHAMGVNYPDYSKRMKRRVAEQIDIWTVHSNHIISGCDWVHYTYYWDTLMLGHFSIDIDRWRPVQRHKKNKSFKILHAPNHRAIKGTDFLIQAVNELKREGYDIDLVLIEKASNDVVKRAIEDADLVVDQLVIGWYAMFAIEAMALGKPVVCYLDSNLENLYINVGLISKDEIPIIKANPTNIKEVIKQNIKNKEKLKKIGENSRKFVLKHHSVEYIGSIFTSINNKLGIKPSLLKSF